MRRYSIPGELDDTGAFNVANEHTARNIDTAGGNDYTLTYDAVGNLTDDGVDYDYVYDWMGRLRKVKTPSCPNTRSRGFSAAEASTCMAAVEAETRADFSTRACRSSSAIE